MAKSARASSKKANNTALRKKVFGPVEEARAKRMSEKLMALAAQPAPPRAEMEVDKENTNATDAANEMDVDGGAAASTASRRSKKTPSRVQKKRRGKPHAQMVFPKKRSALKSAGGSKKMKKR